MAAAMYLEYTQNRLQVAADASCMVDVRRDEPLYLACAAIESMWTLHAGGVFAGVKISVLTQLVRKANGNVSDGSSLSQASGYGLLDTCIHAHNFLQAALDRLSHLGAFTDPSGAPRAYKTLKQVVSVCDGIVESNSSDQAFQYDEHSFDDTEAHVANPNVDWLGNASLSLLVKNKGTLETFADFCLVIGDYATVGARNSIDFIGHRTLGILHAAMQSFSLGGAAVVPPGPIMVQYLPGFLDATRFRFPFNSVSASTDMAALQLWPRSLWASATRATANQLAIGMIEDALEELTALKDALRDFAGAPAEAIVVYVCVWGCL